MLQAIRSEFAMMHCPLLNRGDKNGFCCEFSAIQGAHFIEGLCTKCNNAKYDNLRLNLLVPNMGQMHKKIRIFILHAYDQLIYFFCERDEK